MQAGLVEENKVHSQGDELIAEVIAAPLTR